MHNAIINFPNNTSDEALWLEARKQKLTGSDVAQIMNFLVNGNKNYYDKSIYKFTHDKTNPKPIGQWKRSLFNEGHLVEANVFNKLARKYGEDKVLQNEIFYNDCFMATTDVLVNIDKGSQLLYEVKATKSESNYQDLQSGNHPAAWQACLQLYCAAPSIQKVIIVGVPIREIAEYLKPVRFEITRDGYHYKTFLKHVDTLKKVFEAYMAGEEYFSRKTSTETDISPEISKCCLEYIEIEKKLAELTEEKNKLSNLIKDFAQINGQEEIQVSNTKLSIVKTSRTVVKDEFKKAIKLIEKRHKDNAMDEISSKYADAYEKVESLALRLKTIEE